MPTTFRLRQILKDRGMSQSELSRLSGISFPTINGMCQNRTKAVSLAVLDAIAAALKIQPGDILTTRKIPRS
jgi:putative transcriptional regulator